LEFVNLKKILKKLGFGMGLPEKFNLNVEVEDGLLYFRKLY